MTDRFNPSSIVIASRVKELVDVDLHAELWELCEPVRITHYWSGAPAPATRHADVRLCWNKQALHVRFACEQKEPLLIAAEPVTNTKTIGLWDRDVCEIFLAPDVSNPYRYYEFEAAPTGEWIDLGIRITPSGKETEWEYSSGMKTTNQIGTERILVGMTIPWSERLPKPATGDEWRTNLFRCVGADESTRYLAWRPTQTAEPNFHVPEAFGVLRFA